MKHLKRLLVLCVIFVLTFPSNAFAWEISTPPENTVFGKGTDGTKLTWNTKLGVSSLSDSYCVVMTSGDDVIVLPLMSYKLNNSKDYFGASVKRGSKEIYAYWYFDKDNALPMVKTNWTAAWIVPQTGVSAPDNQWGIYAKSTVSVNGVPMSNDAWKPSAEEQRGCVLAAMFHSAWSGHDYDTKGVNTRTSAKLSDSGITAYELAYYLVQRGIREYSSVEGLTAKLKTVNGSSASYVHVLRSMLESFSSANTGYSSPAIPFENITDAKNDLTWLAKQVGVSNSVEDPSQNQQQEANDVPTTETDVWANWYAAAYKIMSGATEWGGLDESYKSASNLLSMDVEGDEYEHWQKVFDVIAFAYSGNGVASNTTVVTLDSWDPDQEALKEAYENLRDSQRNANSGFTIDQITSKYSSMLQNMTDTLSATVSGTDNARLATIHDRLILLYAAVSRGDVDFEDTNYTWLKSFYQSNIVELYTPSSLVDGNTQLIQFTNGTVCKGYPALADLFDASTETAGYQLLPYLLHTVWEVGYVRDYMVTEMNERINNSTIMDNKLMYETLKELHDAVVETGMPILNTLWETNTEKEGTENLQYKSLKAMWEAVQKDPKVMEQSESESTEPVNLTTGKPLPAFFKDYNANKLSDNYVKGIAYTATLVPMKSNLYSSEWLSYLDSTFREQFYDLYGFHRKALYRDTTAGAGAEYFNSGKVSRGTLELCTLRDMLESKDDIVLYVDDNFYNAEKIHNSQTRVPTYVEEEGEESKQSLWFSSNAQSIEEMYNADFNSIAKTGDSTNYSKIYYNMMNKLDSAHTYYPEATEDNQGNTDSAVMTSGKINYYLNPDQDGSEVYSPLQGYAVISAVYRDGDLFNIANSADVQHPVFISSKSAPYAKGATVEEKLVIYNYALVQNLKESMPVGYSGNLDMDCPLYMDVLGNIVTESGTVIVPAASNATLMNPSLFVKTNWAAGLYAIYGNGYNIPVSKGDDDTILPVISDNFTVDASGKYYIPRARTLEGSYTIDMSRLTTTSKDTLDVIYNRMYADMTNSTTNVYDFYKFFNICMEVMRGAPIESIDKEQEGLLTNDRLDRAGIVAAAKLEDLNKSLGTNGENSTISMPNLAFMPGFNYIALMAFKLLLLTVIIVNMVTVYLDAVGGHLGFQTMWKCLAAIIITMLTILTVPAVFEVTYYQSTRALLQKETAYISMLNLEKYESGVEIGVTEVGEPDIKTELFVKLEDVEVPWYELFYNSIFTDSYKSLNKMYEDYALSHTASAMRDDVQVKNDGVYVSTDDIYASTAVDLDTTSQDNTWNLVQTATNKNSTFSFYSPYYVILDALIRNVNYYNAHPWGDTADNTNMQGQYSYTTKMQKGGRVKTMGLIEPYFTSSAFMEQEGRDLTGLMAAYADRYSMTYNPDPATYQMFTAANMDSIKSSYWYASHISADECAKRLEYLNKEARIFVADNKELLGKISDETFLKVMALTLAIKHNEAFGEQKAGSLEIYNLSSDDLIRMSIADRAEVMLNSTLSYPRFVYCVGGTSTVFAAALLSMVMWISSIVKPLLIIVAFLTIFVSVFVFRVCMRKEGSSLYGYFITTVLLCGTNILYSLLLKLSMYLPTIGLTPFMCIIVQILVQITYMVILLNVVGTAFREWQDLGAARYANKLQDAKVGIFHFMHKDKTNEDNPFYGGTTMRSDPDKNWSYYDKMIDERRKRAR